MKEAIKIGGLYYKVLNIKNLARDFNVLGRCCGNSRTIELDFELDEQVKEKVFLHEILEAINYEYELKLEHEKISILESALYQVFIDNNIFNKFLVKDLEELGELIRALAKMINGEGDMNNLIEEIADVEIGIAHIKKVYNINETEIKEIHKKKNVLNKYNEGANSE